MVRDKLKALQDIANILRRDSLIMTTEAGSGHPTTCLSCAEIMSVLFFNEMLFDTKNPFNPDNDEFILSKGHAAPILYSALYRAGCIKYNLKSLRKINSPLEGHPIPKSLKWVKVATGSLGQGLSAGVGMALAGKLQNKNFKVYVLLGDSEIAEGSVYEALQIASHYRLKNLIAIIDANRLGQTGETMIGHNVNIYKKRFKEFGWMCLTVNGHNIEELINAFDAAKNSDRAVMIIAKTFKGKGVSFLENKNGWHGKPLNKEQLKIALEELPNPEMPKVTLKKPVAKTTYKNSVKSGKSRNLKETFNIKKYSIGQEIATRQAYGNTLAELALKDNKVIAVDAEVSNSTYSEKIKEVSPEQFIETYVAEQNMIGMALGLSKKGFKVFASSFAAFLSRAHDQIRMSALSSGNFTICGSHAGVSIGPDGASQMGLEDISMFRCLPDSIVFYPSDAVSTKKIVKLCTKLKGIKYIRTTRPKTPVIYNNKENFPVGDFKVVRQSKNDVIVLAGAGITLHESLKAYEILKKEGINAAVVDIYCIKPFNHLKFKSFLKKHGNKLIIAEDHYREGGIGEMLIAVLSEEKKEFPKIKHLAITEMPHSGKKDELLDRYKINHKGIVKEAKKMLKK